MDTNELPRALSISGRVAEEDMGEPGYLVKEGTGAENFQLTDAVDDRVLGYTKTGLRTGQHGAVVTVPGSVVLLHNDGAVTQGDRMAVSGTNDGHVTASEDQTDTFVGYALQDAGAGEEVQVLFLANVDEPARALSVATGSEGDQATDAFDVDLTQNLAAADRWLIEVYDNNLDPSSNVQISSQGSETLVSATDQDAAIVDLSADGTATLRFTDSSGTLSADVHVECTPLNGDGEEKQFTLPYS